MIDQAWVRVSRLFLDEDPVGIDHAHDRRSTLHRGGWVLLVILLAAGCAPDYPATIDVQVMNDLSGPATLSLCTTSCGRDDLQETRRIRVGDRTTVTVNGDPDFPSAYLIEQAGGDRCLVVSSRQEPSGIRLTASHPLRTATDCQPPGP